MKRLFILSIIALFSISFAFSGTIQAYMSYSLFNTPDNEPYIETYIVINGHSVKHVQLDDGNYQGVLDMQVIFRIGDSIVNFGKYELSGPKAKDSSHIASTFLDV